LRFFFLAVGKPKHRFYQEGIAHYLEQISHFTEVESIEIKENSLHREKEEKAILEALEKRNFLEGLNRVFLLDDEGKTYRSESFAQMIRNLEDQGIQRCIFIVGGAYGFTKELKDRFPKLSLSSLLFPHDLARLVLVEQVYRALHILNGGKYHHGE
jgi:23S rRNA (pseudouridine1915-N3)-methyltransferase